MIGIFQGSPEGRANKCQRRAKGGLPRATSKKQGKRRAWEGALPKAGQFGSYAGDSDMLPINSIFVVEFGRQSFLKT